MKKILSLGLAVTMAMAAMPAAYAADYTAGTQVEYIADADANREYTITVPALLNPGQSGAVTLKGKWASNETVKVTADATVELTNSINENDKKVLNIGFNGIEKAGDNTVERTYTENVSVAAMPADALFGTWSGKFNYNVEFDDGQPNLIDINLLRITNGTEYPGPAQAEEGMTWRQWTRSSYAIGMSTVLEADEVVNHEYVAGITGIICNADTLKPIHPDDVIAPGTYRLIQAKDLT